MRTIVRTKPEAVRKVVVEICLVARPKTAMMVRRKMMVWATKRVILTRSAWLRAFPLMLTFWIWSCVHTLKFSFFVI